MEYGILLNGRVVGVCSGYDYAWECFHKACELAEMLGLVADLLDMETGEIFASSEEEE